MKFHSPFLLIVIAIVTVALGITVGIDNDRASQDPQIQNGSNGLVSGKSCTKVATAVEVQINPTTYPEETAHIQKAIQDGYPATLHIDRKNAEKNRQLNLIYSPPKEGFDRDEYPPALAKEAADGSHVAYISPSENRAVGAILGNRLKMYCNGQSFRFSFN